MRGMKVRAAYAVLMCSYATAGLSACSEPVKGDDAAAGSIGTVAPLAGCLSRTAGAGFATTPIAPVSRFAVLEFHASASDPDLDGVIGLMSGSAPAFDRLAIAVRFAPGGVIDVRNGGAYQADAVLRFVPGVSYAIRVIADLSAHTYSVYVQTGSDPSAVVRLARGYTFRPSQSGVTSLDTLSAIVDGASGTLSVCDVHSSGATAVKYSREGNYLVTPLLDDQVLLSDGISVTTKLGANGEVLGQIPRGGSAAVDEVGNIYIALVANGEIEMSAYDPSLTLRWSRVESVPGATGVQSIAANGNDVIVALGGLTVRRFPADGSASSEIGTSGTHTAVARDGFVVVHASQNELSLFAYDLTGTLLWQTSFQNKVSLAGVSLDLAGRFVLAGHFTGSINFGGPTLDTVFNGEQDVNCFVAGLNRSDGSHVFTKRIDSKFITGVAANGPGMVIAGEHWVTPIFPHLYHVDVNGGVTEGEPNTGFYEQWGRSGQVALSPTGHLYWQRSMLWPGPNGPTFPYLLAF